MATRKFSVMYMACVLVLLDSSVPASLPEFPVEKEIPLNAFLDFGKISPFFNCYMKGDVNLFWNIIF